MVTPNKVWRVYRKVRVSLQAPAEGGIRKVPTIGRPHAGRIALENGRGDPSPTINWDIRPKQRVSLKAAPQGLWANYASLLNWL